MNARALLAVLAIVLAMIASPVSARVAAPEDSPLAAGQPAAAPIKVTRTPRPTETPTPMPTPTVVPTATAVPSSTPTATATSVPIETPIPTETVEPSATPVLTEPSPTGAVAPFYWGVSMAGVPDDINPLIAWERDVTGKAVSIVHWGHFWGEGKKYLPWVSLRVDNARAHGSIPMISWTPEGGSPSRWKLSTIIDGTHDAYITEFATSAKNWGNPFFLRIMHEMNGSWGYPWQETQNGNSRGEFVQAWRRIVDIFRAEGVNNATYVWCPNIDYPNSTNPTFESLYPGDAYVDWTCLDGYNWGTNRSSGWQTFEQVYAYSYNEILKFAGGKPMMLGEFGSVEEGGSKAEWFSDALTTQVPNNYRQVRAIVYYNRQADGVDWRIETSAASQEAWRAAIAAPFYTENTFGEIGTSPIMPLP